MTRPLVLIVEDDAQMRGVLMLALESHGYAVVAVENDAKALAAIGARPPDAMILDLGLPDIDGIEITARVREEHSLPIIVLSARREEEHQIRALWGPNRIEEVQYLCVYMKQLRGRARPRAPDPHRHRARRRLPTDGERFARVKSRR